MKNWILSIVSIIIIIEIISMILPEGKMGKYIRGTFSLFIMLLILRPMLNFNLDNLYQDITFSNKYEVVYQDDYLEYTTEKKKKGIEDNVRNTLSHCGIFDAYFVIDYSCDTNNCLIAEKVSVNLENAVIISDKEHINIIEDVKTAISILLSIDKGAVLVYE